MGCNSTPFFFTFYHMPIALDVSYLLSFTLQQTLHRHLHQHCIRRITFYNFLLFVTWRAVLTI